MDRATWAREHGVDPRSLNAWRLNLERVGGPRPGMLELVSGDADRRVERTERRYTVRCGEFTVEVPPDFDASVLIRLLGVVAAC